MHVAEEKGIAVKQSPPNNPAQTPKTSRVFFFRSPSTSPTCPPPPSLSHLWRSGARLQPRRAGTGPGPLWSLRQQVPPAGAEPSWGRRALRRTGPPRSGPGSGLLSPQTPRRVTCGSRRRPSLQGNKGHDRIQNGQQMTVDTNTAQHHLPSAPPPTLSTSPTQHMHMHMQPVRAPRE